MRVYHRAPHANTIRAEGFLDGEGTYGTPNTYRGVWVSDVPLDVNEGVDAAALFSIEIPAELFDSYEWAEEGKPYRQALVPASDLNRYGPPSIVSDVELESMGFGKRPG